MGPSRYASAGGSAGLTAEGGVVMIIKSPVFWVIVGTLWLAMTVMTLLGQGFLNPFTALGSIVFYIIAIVMFVKSRK